ncbi:MAG TPA: D-glucuronyl C5-epimerase family protein [Mycobacteriales bacterium]|nr:D-glucuronyl C5-epimerase family protein [Mycobacteriales bacterium]
MIPRTARALALLAVGLGLAVPAVTASASCGLAERPAPNDKHLRTGDLTGSVRVYGDSITFQAWRRLAERMPSLGVDAFWGTTTRPTVDRVLADAERKAPSVVVLAVGTNDARDPSQMKAEVRRAREELPASTRLLWMNAYTETSTGWRDVDVAIASQPGVEVVEWAAENVRARGTGARSPLLSDGVHLSCQGGGVWVDLVQRALDRPTSPHHTSGVGPSVALGDFRQDDAPVLTGLPPERLPFARTAPLAPGGLVDREGVRLVEVDGHAYDHPTAQAEYGIALLESLRLTGDGRYLALARAQADRLVARHVVEAGAWFYPHPFDASGPGGQVREAPWFSARAQGLALSLLTRIAAVTGDPRYVAAADLTFASLLVPPAAGKPWVSRVSEHQLWFEEAPRGVSGSRTLVGHVDAALGVYDYYAATGLPPARSLLAGALATTTDAVRRIRVPGGASRDGTVHRTTSVSGHAVRIRQLLALQSITGLPRFARLADALYGDTAPPDRPGRMVLQPGTHTGFRFAADGSVLSHRSVQVGRPVVVSSPVRVRVPGRSGTWLEVGAGPLRGLLVREQAGARYRLGATGALTYLAPRRATFEVATTQVVQVAASGRRTVEQVAYRAGQRVAVDGRAVLNGVPMLRLASGPDEGWWLPVAAVRLD